MPGHGFELTTVPFGWGDSIQSASTPGVCLEALAESKGADMIYALDPTSVGPAAYLVARGVMPFLVRLGGDYAWSRVGCGFGVTDTLSPS